MVMTIKLPKYLLQLNHEEPLFQKPPYIAGTVCLGNHNSNYNLNVYIKFSAHDSFLEYFDQVLSR
jgi:hypothetical protein